MHFYHKYLSTSFSTHPKHQTHPLAWDKKPFQSRRVPLLTFRHDETVQISIFFRNFFIAPKGPPINFLYFATEWMFKKSQRVPPFTFFGTMRLTGDFKKKFKKIYFSSIFSWVLLFSPLVEKVVLESYWALDMAPTWAVPGLFFCKMS